MLPWSIDFAGRLEEHSFDCPASLAMPPGGRVGFADAAG